MNLDDDAVRERLRLAYHEAAHAVVGLRFGWSVGRVELHANGGRYTPGFNGGVPLIDSQEWILLVLAGRFGETIITGEGRSVSDDWLRFVIETIRTGDNDPRFDNHDDFIVMRTLIATDSDAGDSDLIDSYRDWEEDAEALVADPNVRSRIETLAESLFRCGYIGEEAKALIEEACPHEVNSEAWDAGKVVVDMSDTASVSSSYADEMLESSL